MRNEFKYLVPNEQLDDLRKTIMGFVDHDPFSPADTWRNEYIVRSIYFDTPELEYYYEKKQGIISRKKIRIRSYNQLTDYADQNPFISLEIKRKEIDFVGKNRSKVQWNNLTNLFNTGDLEKYLENSDNPEVMDEARKFFYHVKGKDLRPVVLVVYEREAFFSKFDNSFRISFDKHIRSKPFPKISELFENNGLTASLYKEFVLELKFSGSFPYWMTDVLFKYKLKRLSVSKYKFSLDTYKVWKKHNRINIWGLGY